MSNLFTVALTVLCFGAYILFAIFIGKVLACATRRDLSEIADRMLLAGVRDERTASMRLYPTKGRGVLCVVRDAEDEWHVQL